MSRQRCRSRARQRRYLLPPVALAYKNPYVSTKLSKLRYVEILDFAFISTYFLLGMWFKKILVTGFGFRIATVKFTKKIFVLVTRTTEMSAS